VPYVLYLQQALTPTGKDTLHPMTDTPDGQPTESTTEPPTEGADLDAAFRALIDGELPPPPTEPTEPRDDADAAKPPPLTRDEVARAWRMVNQLEVAATWPLFMVKAMVFAMQAEEAKGEGYTEAQRAELRETRILVAAVVAKRMQYGE
jgi:hypothetical protein